MSNPRRPRVRRENSLTRYRQHRAYQELPRLRSGWIRQAHHFGVRLRRRTGASISARGSFLACPGELSEAR